MTSNPFCCVAGRTRAWFIGLGVLVLCTATAAQTMYRCANVYQDRPCDAAQPGKVVNTSGAGVAAAPKPVIPAECAQRGEAAQQIAWVRETGQTEAMQLAAHAGGRDTALISEVYRLSGPAAQVRAAIEAQCVADIQRMAQTSTLLNSLTAPQAAAALPPSNPLPASVPAPPGPSPEVLARQRAEASARAATANQKARCEALVTRLETIRQSQRLGGNVNAVEDLRQQVRNAEQQVRAAGC